MIFARRQECKRDTAIFGDRLTDHRIFSDELIAECCIATVTGRQRSELNSNTVVVMIKRNMFTTKVSHGFMDHAGIQQHIADHHFFHATGPLLCFIQQFFRIKQHEPGRRTKYQPSVTEL